MPPLKISKTLKKLPKFFLTVVTYTLWEKVTLTQSGGQNLNDTLTNPNIIVYKSI